MPFEEVILQFPIGGLVAHRLGLGVGLFPSLVLEVLLFSSAAWAVNLSPLGPPVSLRGFRTIFGGMYLAHPRRRLLGGHRPVINGTPCTQARSMHSLGVHTSPAWGPSFSQSLSFGWWECW